MEKEQYEKFKDLFRDEAEEVAKEVHTAVLALDAVLKRAKVAGLKASIRVQSINFTGFLDLDEDCKLSLNRLTKEVRYF